MMQNRIFLWLFIALLSTKNLRAVNLSEAIQMLYKNNNQLKGERMRVKEANSAFAGAALSILPDIRAGKTLYQDSTYVTLGDISTSSGRVNKERHNFGIQETLSVNNIVLDPVRAVQMIKIQKLSSRITEQNILLQAVGAYLDVIRDNQILKASRDNEAILKQYTGLVRRRFAVGEVTKTDIEQTKARFSAMQSSRIQAEGNLQVSNAVYKRVFGEEVDALEMPTQMPQIPEDFEEFSKMVVKENLEIKTALLNRKISKIDVTRSIGSVLPSVSASYSSLKNDDAYLAQGCKQVKSYMIDLSIPIVPRGGSDFARIFQAKYASSRSGFEYENSKLLLEQQILETWNNVKTIEANLEAAKATVEFTALAMNAVKREAEYGSRTMLDVLNSELEHFNANVGLIRVQYARVMSYYRLLATLGKLDKNVF